MAECVYVVIRTLTDHYQKQMLLSNARYGEVPLLRINFSYEPNAKTRRQLIEDAVSALLNTEFNDLKIQRIRRIARLGRRGARIFLIELTGWPEPKEGRHLYFFADRLEFHKLPHNSRRILRLTDAALERIKQKKDASRAQPLPRPQV